MIVISHADIDRMYVARDVDGLIRALTTAESKDVRQLAAKALGELGDPRATEPLIRALRDRDILRTEVAVSLGQMGVPAVEVLIQAMADPEIRWGAVTALGAIGDKRAIEHIINVCTSVDSLLRGAAVIALGRIGGNRAVETLIYVAEKEEGFGIRRFAIEALGEIGGASAREALVRATKHPDASTREAAEEALKKIEIGDAEAAVPQPAADQATHTELALASVRCDGLYQSESSGEYSYFLRFLEDGTVRSISAAGKADQVFRWWDKDPFKGSSGTYVIEGSEIKFSVRSSSGVVDYEGEIQAQGESLLLQSYSHINSHRAKNTFWFVPVLVS